jgi:radical SAM family uncharacterized protein
MNREEYLRLLTGMEKPYQYTGGELNCADCSDKSAKKMAIVFPDTYEIGMSHVGVRIIYHLVNSKNDMICERAFHPWVDLENLLRERDEPLRTLETSTPLKELPLIGFSLAYEMLYANVLNILDLSKIPLESKDRGEEDPIIMAGGPCSYNPEPIAPFVDIVLIGEAEEIICQIVEIANDKNISRRERILAIGHLKGCYNPSDTKLTTNPDSGRVTSVEFISEPDKKEVTKVFSRNLNDAWFPCNPIVPNAEIVHDRANLEIHRGCLHGCRFCQAGYIYRPFRIRATDKLLDMADEILSSTGYEELGLVSLNTVDHPDILSLSTTLDKDLHSKRISLGFPSLRMDAISSELVSALGHTKKNNITLAPEAGSQRMRNLINKNLTEEQILHSVQTFTEGGWQKMKLYFMVGLPQETDEDILAIADLVQKIVQTGRQGKKDAETGKLLRTRPFMVTVNISSFVAKSHTPFQWEKMADLQTLKNRMKILLDELKKNKSVSIKWRDFDLGLIEGLLARGDRRLAPVIKRVWEAGGRLESWSDRFSFSRWEKALSEEGLDLNEYIFRDRDDTERLPWEHLSCGVSTDFLRKERRKAIEEESTKNCLTNICSNCGFGSDCPVHTLKKEIDR